MVGTFVVDAAVVCVVGAAVVCEVGAGGVGVGVVGAGVGPGVIGAAVVGGGVESEVVAAGAGLATVVVVLASGVVEPSALTAGETAVSGLATEAAPPVAEVTDAESARASIASWLVSSTAVSTATHQALSLIRHPSSRPRSFAIPTETPHS